MADPYVIFPGTAGNYVSTDDINLLDCDSSWFAQGSGGLWTVGTPSAEQAKGDSPRSLKITGGVSTAITPATDAADFSLFVYSAAGDDFDLNGGAPVTVPAGVWSALTHAGNAGSYTVNAAGTGDYYLAEVMLGAVAFVPSLRIVGDLDLEIVASSPDWSNGVQVLLARMETSSSVERAFQIWQDANGYNYFRVYAAGSNIDFSTNLYLVDGELYDLRFVADVGNEEMRKYVDGVLTGSVRPSPEIAGGLQGGDSYFSIGGSGGGSSPLTGNVYSAEVRDGIDGPVVARFDAGDVPVPAQIPA